MTRREIVIAFAALSLHLGRAFDVYLEQLNPRERKLVHVYREKQQQQQQQQQGPAAARPIAASQ